MTVLIPGTVVGYLPYVILAPLSPPRPDEWSWTRYAAVGVAAIGSWILLRCIWDFARHGRGTLAPFDEPRSLVIKGLYRYVRNPMYVGVLLILLAESAFFWSGELLAYTGIWFAAINVVIMGLEEPRLRSKFGVAYEQYRREVGRWLPGKAYRHHSRERP